MTMKTVWNKTDEIARNMRRPINTAAISILGTYTFLWGLWLTMPWSTFNRGPIYDLMSILAPELIWGISAMVIGGIIMYGVSKNAYAYLRRGALIGFYYWFIIAAFYALGSWQSTGWINSAMVAIYCAFVSLNLRINKNSLHDNKEVHNI